MPASIASRRQRPMICMGASVLFLSISLAANAAPKTITLSIPGMDCPVCPITVKKALSQVAGVSQTIVNFEKRQAVVTFDDTRTDVGALIDSTRNAGYPSTLAGAAD